MFPDRIIIVYILQCFFRAREDDLLVRKRPGWADGTGSLYDMVFRVIWRRALAKALQPPVIAGIGNLVS